jgi:acyl carrier protein
MNRGREMEKTEAKIRNILAMISGVDEEEITPEKNIDDLYLDSLDMLQVVVSIEDRFDVQVGCADRLEFSKVEDLTRFVESKLVHA